MIHDRFLGHHYILLDACILFIIFHGGKLFNLKSHFLGKRNILLNNVGAIELIVLYITSFDEIFD